MDAIAVILCTYNRSELLNKCLVSLAVSLASQVQLRTRLIVVDNNSTDATAEIIRSYQDRLLIVHLTETQQGKTHALNSGLAALQDEELVIFCDDDCVFDQDWVLAFIDAAKSHPEAAWFGGRVLPDWQGRRPSWLREDTRMAFRGYFIEYDLGREDRSYRNDDPLPLGASMAVRRIVIDQVGTFRTDLGPRGGARGMGDDTEYIMRAKEAGFQGRYLASALCHHHIHPSRYRLREFYRYGFAKGLNQARHDVLPAEFRRSGRVVPDLLKAMFQFFKGRGDRFRLCLINLGLAMGARKASGESTRTG